MKQIFIDVIHIFQQSEINHLNNETMKDKNGK